MKDDGPTSPVHPKLKVLMQSPVNLAAVGEQTGPRQGRVWGQGHRQVHRLKTTGWLLSIDMTCSTEHGDAAGTLQVSYLCRSTQRNVRTGTPNWCCLPPLTTGLEHLQYPLHSGVDMRRTLVSIGACCLVLDSRPPPSHLQIRPTPASNGVRVHRLVLARLKQLVACTGHSTNSTQSGRPAEWRSSGQLRADHDGTGETCGVSIMQQDLHTWEARLTGAYCRQVGPALHSRRSPSREQQLLPPPPGLCPYKESRKEISPGSPGLDLPQVPVCSQSYPLLDFCFASGPRPVSMPASSPSSSVLSSHPA